MFGAKVVEVFRTLHLALGRWYWFLFLTLSLITIHTIDHTTAVFIDRGSTSGIDQGMAVVNPDGIVGKVTAVYPLVSQVLLVTETPLNQP